MRSLDNGQYFGATLKSRNINGIILTEKIHSAAEILPEHCHTNAYFCNVLKGYWIEKFRNKERECKPRKSIYHPPGETHSDTFEQSGHTFNIEFAPERFKQFTDISSTLSSSNEFYYDEINLISMKIFNEFKTADDFSSMAIEGLTLELVANSARKFSKIHNRINPDWLTKVKEILRDRYLDKLSLKEISDEIDIHPVHISRSFRKMAGCTLSEFQRKIRIEKACIDLQKEDVSITNVALKYSFYDQSHFSRLFKNTLGLTPLQYRKYFSKS